MDPIRIALVNVLLPAAICGALLAVGWLWRAPAAAGQGATAMPAWLGAGAMVLAFLAAHRVMLGTPDFSLADHRGFYAAAAVGVAAGVLSVMHVAVMRLALLVIAGIGVTWLIAAIVLPPDLAPWQRWLIIVATGAAGGAVMHSTAELSQRLPGAGAGWTWTLPMLPAFACAAMLCIRSGYAKYAQMAIAAAAPVGMGMLMSLWLGRPLGRGAGAAAAGLLAIILLGGYFHGYPVDPGASFALVGLSPLVMWIDRSRVIGGGPSLKIAGARLVAVMVMLGIAALLAIRLAGW